MIDVSVIIINYNVKDLLLKCLKSIYNYTDPSLVIDIIVVDNDSKDGSVEAIRNIFPKITVIANKFNAGFPHANNQGFEIARGKYLFMLNPDTEFISDTLLSLFQKMESDVEISLIAPALLNSDLTHQQSVWRFPTLFNIFCEMHYIKPWLANKNYADKDINKPFLAESFSGAAIFFRAEVIKQIGLLDETMFWIEDVEFCFRASKVGLKLLYYPQSKIIHHVGQSAKKNYRISISNQIFNKIKFFKKHKPFLSYICTVLLSFYHVLLKLIIFGLLAPFNIVYRRKAIAYAYTLPKVFNPPTGIA
jgi:GT2 family glycosyltransferase